MDVKEQDILGDLINHHWYYRAKGAAMTRLLAGAPVLVEVLARAPVLPPGRLRLSSCARLPGRAFPG